MRNAGLDEAQTGIKIARRNINTLRYADDTTLMAESKEELKILLMKVPNQILMRREISICLVFSVPYDSSLKINSEAEERKDYCTNEVLEYWWFLMLFSCG